MSTTAHTSHSTSIRGKSSTAAGSRASDTMSHEASVALPKFVQWVYETYQNQLRLSDLEGSRKFRNFIESADIKTFSLSGARRTQSFHVIKFGYPMRHAGYVTAAFTVRVFEPGSTSLQREAHYAYMYWPLQTGKASAANEPEYICLSPTFESRDGEYRHNFLWFKQFQEGYETNTSLLSRIEECILEAIADDEVGFDTLFYPNDDSKHRTAHKAAIAYADTSRLGLKSLVAILAVDALRAKMGTLQNHASSGYVQVMEVLYKKCQNALKGWSEADRALMSVFETGKPNQPHRTQCGQKLIPLTIRESLHINDINFSPWREIWISERVTDLIVNGIAPMFPIYNNWTYLDGIDQSIFENSAMRERFSRSLQAEKVAASLRQARELAGQDRATESDARMGQLDAHILESLEYAQDYIMLTNLAMCSTSEYVGMTLYSLPTTIRRSSAISPAFLRMFENPAMQAKYFFDLCYGAHVLHTRVGAIHGDLHVNNMTLYELSNQFKGTASDSGIDFTSRYKNPVIAYVVGGDNVTTRGEADTYIFPHDGWFACLIDFSRVIIGPGVRRVIAAKSGEAFTAGFYRSQITRALRILHYYIPSYVKQHQEKIKGFLLADFETLFRIMTAVDFLAIGRNYGALLQEVLTAHREPGDKTTLKVASDGIRLAKIIEEKALAHIISHLIDLVEDKAGRRRGIEVPFAGDTILPSVFDNYRYSAWASGAIPAHIEFTLANATLVDVYNGAAPFEYSGSDPAQFPPWARFDKLEQHLGGIKIAQVTADRGKRMFLESQDLNGYLAVLQEQVHQNLDNKPAAATSSWIVY